MRTSFPHIHTYTQTWSIVCVCVSIMCPRRCCVYIVNVHWLLSWNAQLNRPNHILQTHRTHAKHHRCIWFCAHSRWGAKLRRCTTSIYSLSTCIPISPKNTISECCTSHTNRKRDAEMPGGWWMVAGGWWLGDGGWWLVAGGCHNDREQRIFHRIGVRVDAVLAFSDN